MSKLQCCPFCGGEAEETVYETYSLDSSFDCIACKDCGACIPNGTKETWNSRNVKSIRTRLSQAEARLEEAVELVAAIAKATGNK